MRIATEKRMALATCRGLLDDVSRRLEALHDVEDLAPLSLQVANLRRRRRRLEEELRAIAAEWAA
jgi:hypothetical protein